MSRELPYNGGHVRVVKEAVVAKRRLEEVRGALQWQWSA